MDGIIYMRKQKVLIILLVILTIAMVSVLSTLFKDKYNTAASNQATSANNMNINNTSNNSIIDDSDDNSFTQPAEEPPVVIIDAGHGDWEPGAGNKTINEKDIVLAISLEVENVLKEKNIAYYMTRNDDTYVSLEDRVGIANEKVGKLFVSIHNNSFTDPNQRGILTTYNPSSPIGKEIAEIMQSKISDIGMKNRNVMPRPNLHVLRHTEMPSLLLEIGFISNQQDLTLLTDISFQKKCAQQIVLGIEEIVAAIDGEESPAID